MTKTTTTSTNEAEFPYRKPPRPKSTYLKFYMLKKDEIGKKLKTTNAREISKECTRIWNLLKESKDPIVEELKTEYLKDKEEYYKDKGEYEKKVVQQEQSTVAFKDTRIEEIHAKMEHLESVLLVRLRDHEILIKELKDAIFELKNKTN